MRPSCDDPARPVTATSPPVPAEPRPYRRLILFVSALAVIGIVHVYLVSYGTWQLIGPELRSSAYDSLGDHLLRFDASLDPDTVNWEGLDINGKKYMYWGPFPAIVRIPLNLIWKDAWGKWGRVGSLLASLLCLAGFALTIHRALEDNRNLSRDARDVLFVLLFLGWGLGSPLLYLVSTGRIYHEAITWALAATTWALYGAIAYLRSWLPPGRALLIASTAAGISLLSRVTFGVPVYGILAILAATHLLRQAPFSRQAVRGAISAVRFLILPLLPAVVMLVYQAWYNYDRFGSIKTFMDYKYCYLNPDETMEGVLNFKRIPVLFQNYLGFRTAYFLPDPPYFQMATADYYKKPFFNHDWIEQTVSLSLASPWLVLGAALGTPILLRRRNWPALLMSLSLLSQVVLILSFWSASHRYSAEIVPWLALPLIYLVAEGMRFSVPRAALWGVLSLGSIFTTVSSTLTWHAFYAAPDVDVPRDWQGRLMGAFRVMPEIPAWEGARVYADTLDPLKLSHSFSAPQFLAKSGEEATFGPYRFEHAILAHARTQFTLEVPAGAVAFESIVSIAESGQRCQKASLRFRILGEGNRELFASGLFTCGGAVLRDGSVAGRTSKPLYIRVPLHGEKQLTLLVDEAGNGHDCDHGAFYSPAFLIGGATDSR